MKWITLYEDQDHSVELFFGRPPNYTLSVSYCPEEVSEYRGPPEKDCCDPDFELPADAECVLIRKTHIFRLNLIFWSVTLEFTRWYRDA